jgi:hypothetical protein
LCKKFRLKAIAPDNWMVIKNELKGMSNEAVVIKSKSQNIPGGLRNIMKLLN